MLTVATPGDVFHAAADDLLHHVGEIGQRPCFDVTPSDTTARSSSRFACDERFRDALSGNAYRICASLSRIRIATLISVPIANSTITRLSFARARGDFLYPGDSVQRVLDRFGQVVFNRLRAGAGYCTTVNANGRFTSGMGVDRKPEAGTPPPSP